MAEPNEEQVGGVAQKYAAWASSLPDGEQQILRYYMSRYASDEVRGYQYESTDDWSRAFMDTYWYQYDQYKSYWNKY